MHHDVKIDLRQLWEYRQLPIGHQPFYVFPKPDWGGTLEDEAIADGRAVTELGFTRSGPGWWFADWMVVLTAAEVAAVLHRELAAYGSKKRRTTRSLVQFAVDPTRRKSTCTWGPSKKAHGPEAIGWLDFWPELEQCGRSGWPQLIRVPERFVVNTRGPYLPEQVADALREVADTFAPEEWENYGPLVTLEPDADGNYQLTEDPDDNFVGSYGGTTAVDGVDEIGNHRQVVFLDAWALRSAR